MLKKHVKKLIPIAIGSIATLALMAASNTTFAATSWCRGAHGCVTRSVSANASHQIRFRVPTRYTTYWVRDTRNWVVVKSGKTGYFGFERKTLSRVYSSYRLEVYKPYFIISGTIWNTRQPLQ